MKNKII